jgi:hypothetical protein
MRNLLKKGVEPTPETWYMPNTPPAMDTVKHNIHAIPEDASLLLLQNSSFCISLHICSLFHDAVSNLKYRALNMTE